MNTKEIVFSFIDRLSEDAVVCDMTLGNGYDAAYICAHIPAGILYGFDIQSSALTRTRERLGETSTSLRLFQDTHASCADYLKEPVDLAVYNLGYLPGADKSITTDGESVIKSFESLWPFLKTGAFVLFTLYPGHEPGRCEEKILTDYFEKTDQKRISVMRVQGINQKNNPPYVLLVRKLVDL